jgi:sodium transport system permease protein
MTSPAERALPVLAAAAALLAGIAAMFVAVQAPVGSRLALILGHTALAVPFVLATLALGRTLDGALGLRRVPPRTALLAVVCGAGFWVASAGLLELQYSVWPAPPEVLEFFRRLHAKLDLWPLWSGAFSLFAIAVWPAVVEELAFRGALLGAFRALLGDTAAVALTAGLFAVIHIVPGYYRVPFTFALGAALGALRVRTGSIVPGIVAHAVLNATTVVVSAALDAPDDPSPTISIPAAAAALALGALIAASASRSMKNGPRTDWGKINR